MSLSQISRRRLLKLLAATAGTAMLSSVPIRWKTPVVQVGEFPVDAQVRLSGTGAISGTIHLNLGTASPTQGKGPTANTFTVDVITPHIDGVISPPTFDAATNTDNYAYLISPVPAGTNYTVSCTFAGTGCSTGIDTSGVVVNPGLTTMNIDFSFDVC